MKTLGVFISDVHLPDEIDLKPVFKYVKDLYDTANKNRDRFVVILGGDIIDAKGLHGVESMTASQIRLEWYERDCKLLADFLNQLHLAAPKAEVIFLSGNHEERYERIMIRYPDAWGGRFDFHRDVIKKVFPKAKWIPYATPESYYKLGDCYFIHGTWPLPDFHAKKIAQNHSPFKVVYGHMHTWQTATIHNAITTMPARYAITAGCLCRLAPEWKRGSPHQWIDGFCDFVSDNGVTTPTPHIIEKGQFTIGGKTFK